MSRNLVPRVPWLFGQRLVARRDSGDSKKFNVFDWLPRNDLHYFTANLAAIKFQHPRVSPGDKPLAKEPEDSGYEWCSYRSWHGN